MNLSFHIVSLQLLIFCMDDQKFATNFHYVSLCFLLQQQVNYFKYCFIILLDLISSLSHSGSLLVPYAYVSGESTDCTML